MASSPHAVGLDTEGRRLFCEWLEGDPDRSQTSLAKILGIGQSSVSLWKTGKARPEPAVRDALKILTGIEPNAWDTAEEREVVERARKATASIPPPPRSVSKRAPPARTRCTSKVPAKPRARRAAAGKG